MALRGVDRTFPGVVPVVALAPTDLELWPGEMVTITGPSGSGKSTLLNIIGLLDRPTNGHLEVDGSSLSGCDDHERATLRAELLGFVFQSFHLLPHRTVLDNVALGGVYRGIPRTDRYARARAAVDRVGLSHRLLARADTLSGGEKQRVAIARAILGGPKVLLCDEPTGNLDSVNSNMIAELLVSLAESGICVVVVTHERELADRGTRGVAIHDGLVEATPHQPIEGPV